MTAMFSNDVCGYALNNVTPPGRSVADEMLEVDKKSYSGPQRIMKFYKLECRGKRLRTNFRMFFVDDGYQPQPTILITLYFKPILRVEQSYDCRDT
jgi:hypothetical protein